MPFCIMPGFKYVLYFRYDFSICTYVLSSTFSENKLCQLKGKADASGRQYCTYKRHEHVIITVEVMHLFSESP